MKFLLDQDVYKSTAQYLMDLQHNIVSVAQLGLSRADDEKLLKVGQQQKRLFVTRDRDFGRLVFLKRLCAGVLYLRMLPSTQDAVHNELGSVLKTYDDIELAQAFVVIQPGGHRIRRFSSQRN